MGYSLAVCQKCGMISNYLEIENHEPNCENTEITEDEVSAKASRI